MIRIFSCRRCGAHISNERSNDVLLNEEITAEMLPFIASTPFVFHHCNYPDTPKKIGVAEHVGFDKE